MQPTSQPTDVSTPPPRRRRGRGRPWRKGENGALRLSQAQLEVIGNLTRQLTERDGQPPGPAALVLVSQVAKLACAPKREDAVRNARAIGVLLAQLGLAGAKPEEPKPQPSLAEHLAARRAAQAASDGKSSPAGSARNPEGMP